MQMRKIMLAGRIGQQGQLASEGMAHVAATTVSDVCCAYLLEAWSSARALSYPEFDGHVK
jgi:hypothetical protein